MNLTESYTKESYRIETYTNGLWELDSLYSSRAEAETALAVFIDNTPEFTQARIIQEIVKTTTDKWLLKQIEL